MKTINETLWCKWWYCVAYVMKTINKTWLKYNFCSVSCVIKTSIGHYDVNINIVLLKVCKLLMKHYDVNFNIIVLLTLGKMWIKHFDVNMIVLIMVWKY